MTKEEREIHIKNLGTRKTYNKLNDTMKNILKELKGYESIPNL